MPHLPTTCAPIPITPKKSANACGFCFAFTSAPYQVVIISQRLLVAGYHAVLGGPGAGLIWKCGGDFMKRMVLVGAVLAMTGSAFAADMPLKAVKAPAPFDPWDIAFGAAAMNDYLFRGITQSNHNPSVAAYFEPRYNVTKDLQLYIGTSAESISFPNRAAAEVDIYGGIRPPFR